MIWVYIATGFTGAWTLWFLGRAAMRRVGQIASITAYFSPKGGCQDAIVREIKAARREDLGPGLLLYRRSADLWAD